MSDTETTSKKESEVAHEQASRVAAFKIAKSRKKAAFTRARNRLIDEIEDENFDKILAKELIDKLEETMDSAIQAIETLAQEYNVQGKTLEMLKVTEETVPIETEYYSVLKKYHDTEQSDVSSTVSSKHLAKNEKASKKQIDLDLTHQMKRVSIPVFSGLKKDYSFWKAAFTACIDETDATDEYKFLQLRQYLSGEALKAVEGLGHSSYAYEKAKERLDRKYGGQRRTVNKFFDDIERFQPIKSEHARELEYFADLLDVALVNIKEANMEDLHSGFMYQQLLKKLPETMITRYERWIFENNKKESVEMLSEWVLRESEFMTIALETKQGLDYQVNQKDNKNDKRTFFTSVRKCTMCEGPHGIWECEQFLKIPVHKRWESAKSLHLCYRCLGSNHSGKNCRRTRKCDISGCSKVHHKLLHKSDSSYFSLNPSANSFSLPENCVNSGNADQNQTYTTTDKKYIALRTVPVFVCANGREMLVNALLDDGSTKTYMNRDVAAELGLEGDRSIVHVNVLNGDCEFETMNINFQLKNIDRNLHLNITAQTANNITGNLKPIDWQKHSTSWSHLKGIRFPTLSKRSKVDLLIGLDYSELHRCMGEVCGKISSPTARLTPLGWTCIGPINNMNEHNHSLYTFKTVQLEEVQEIDDSLKRFWEIETVENRVPMKPEECKALEFVQNTVIYDKESENYIVSIPWKSNKPELENNYDNALKRFQSTEKKLEKNPNLKKAYSETLENYEKKGYITKMNSDNEQSMWYMPHFSVVHPEKETTKVRIVFDASAKYKDLSLNDVIYQCPKLQNELFDILLRFRKNAVAIMCDIQEMYLQVELASQDRRFHRFLWRANSSESIETYEFNRIVFGVNASPFLAQFVSQHNAKHFEQKYQRAAESVMKSTYMDDTMDSVENEKLAISLYHELSELWQLAGMRPRKWMSNSPGVLAEIPREERAYKTELSNNELPTLKTLGLNWDSQEDYFFFRNTKVDKLNVKLTKKIVLKEIASLFDPLGFLTPFTVRAKMIMQDIWVSGIDWDDELSPHLANQIRKWFSELGLLSEISIQRCLHVTKKDKIHTFVDASCQAYGAVVYIAHEHEKTLEYRPMLIAAKSRVAPLKSLSIPRLELLAATLGLKLTESVCSALEIPIENTVFWSDSMNVLYWIHGASRQYKTFVENRVGTIHDVTSPKQWRHVPTEYNPADLASRGSSIHQLANCQLWWHGPEFLQRHETIWPENKFKVTEEAKVELKRKSAHRQNLSFLITDDIQQNRLRPENYSNFNRLVRIHAWVNRFIDNCQVKQLERRLTKELCLSEIQDAENSTILRAQVESFQQEYTNLSKGKTISVNSRLAPLNPRIDTEGIMRSDSRLKCVKYLPYSVRYPIILPRKHWTTKLIVKHHHELANHGGTNQTLASLSKRFWILSAREEIREWETTCAECRRRKARASTQIMAPLPAERLTQSVKAFTNTAVDYAGPFITKQGRGKVRLKRYLCVFTCMATRAVHLEVAYSMDTNSFLNTLSRFVSRRGVPYSITSDNGTNFVGCVNELRELYKQLDKNAIIRHTGEKRINWKFLPPNAPHFGGVHESMVKCAKRALFKILKDTNITDEELVTAVVGAEALINSRPLTYQTSSPEDDTVLTPNHFLHGQCGGSFAPDIHSSSATDLKKRWRYVQELLRHFWKRWLREYLPTIGSRKKWCSSTRDYKPGDVVMVIDPDVHRGQWQLGRVVRAYQGRDQRVRVVDVRVGQAVLRRPISRISIIEKCDSV